MKSGEVDEVGLKMGDDLASAICKIISEIKPLEKSEENRFAGYSYVPIDAYYASYGKAMARHGLTFVSREVDVRLVEVTASAEKRGRGGRDEPATPRTMVQATYEFDLYLAGKGCVTGVGRTTVIQGLTGPQTAGSMQSYAEKVFFRTLLKAVTGEQDGDAEEPVRSNGSRPVHSEPDERFPGARQESRREEPEERRRDDRDDRDRRDEPRRETRREEDDRPRQEDRDDRRDERRSGRRDEPDGDETQTEENAREDRESRAPRLSDAAKAAISKIEGGLPVMRKNAEDYSVVLAIFEAFAPTVGAVGALRSWWEDNLDVLDRIKANDVDTYNRIARIFKERKTALEAR